ncbi:MAG: serine hydrolase [Actinomadura sp.]
MRHVTAITLTLALTTGCTTSSAQTQTPRHQALPPVAAPAPDDEVPRISTARKVPDVARLRRTTVSYLKTRPGRAAIVVRDLHTDATFEYAPHTRFVTASVMKVNILTALLLQRQPGGLTGTERSLATRMIRFSDNAAADVLYSRAGGGAGVTRTNRRLGLKETVPYPTRWGASQSSAADQVRLLRALTRKKGPLNAKNRRYVLDLMRSVTPSQAWGIRVAAATGEAVAVKNGWTPLHHQGTGWAVNSIGRITGPDHDFLIAIFTTGQPGMSTGIQTAEHLADLTVDALRGS